MNLNLSKNIQMLRKERSMTQEQLAEAMGVTIGAVSKWENALSNPDLYLIVEMAQFFEVSVDVLLGYEWEKSTAGTMAKRIEELDKKKQFDAGIAESKKAIQKYPNSFVVVYQSALLYCHRGIESAMQKEDFEKALTLYQQALHLIDQNQDENVNRETLQIYIAEIYGYLDRMDEAIDLLKKYNAQGSKNDMIGVFYAKQKKYDKAEEYLSKAFYKNMVDWINTCFGLVNCYMNTKRLENAISLSLLIKSIIEPLVDKKIGGYMLKLYAYIDIILAFEYAMQPTMGLAETHMRNAISNGKLFDAIGNLNCEIGLVRAAEETLYDNGGNAAQLFKVLLESNKSELSEEAYIFMKQIYEEEIMGE